jgi:hypothetical protein
MTSTSMIKKVFYKTQKKKDISISSLEIYHTLFILLFFEMELF